MTGSAQLLDELRERGFTPDEGEQPYEGIECFDLPAGPNKVRVALNDSETIVYVMTGNGVVQWFVRVSDNNPPSALTAIIDLAIAHAGTGETGGS